MNTKRFTIGVLSITATILLVGVVLLSASRPVQASGMNARGGDYVMATVQSNSSTEQLVVIDAATSRMLVYQYNVSRRELEISTGIDFARLEQQPQKGRRRR
jgi:hypothetical protein